MLKKNKFDERISKLEKEIYGLKTLIVDQELRLREHANNGKTKIDELTQDEYDYFKTELESLKNKANQY